MVHDVEFRTLLLYAIFVVCTAKFDPQGDDILFHVNWPGGAPQDLQVEELNKENSIEMTTPDNEKYRCILPKDAKGKYTQDSEDYDGLGPRDLIDPLFSMSSCSYRIESYWTYELCHGKHIRQYHEEKDPGKPVKKQEFYLGYYSLADQKTEEEKAKEKVQAVKVEGYEFPFYPVNMTSGTNCDLTGRPRRVTLAYICQPEGKGELYEVKEISTCEYQIIVFTRLLCSHPGYRQKSSYVNSISCHALGGAPKRPKTLDNLELESAQGRYTKTFSHHDQEPSSEMGVDAPQPPVEETAKPTEQQQPDVTLSANSAASKQLLRDFLNGDYCLAGGTGWWRHEFCFSKHVIQFHDHNKERRETITLGRWNEEVHRNFMKEHPEKRPQQPNTRKYVMHYYANGDFCELTGKTRSVEVKLRCKEDPSRPTSMSIYLMEERTCAYSLVVESPILCPLIEQADFDGIIQPPS